jgi:NAD(P)-dependent dehydrogenase (short-subunit alcohol dehydrogenase family)
MAHILITGSADGLGRAAAETLLGDGHQVIVHTRSAGRLAAVEPLISRGASAVIGDLADLDQTRALADQVNRLGRLDAVIHNAGVMSKLFLTTLAMAAARLWPGVYSNAVDPGWVPTRMGGPGAPDDLRLGHLTQQWLATSDAPEARTSGGYWYHQQRRTPHPAALDPRFQDELLAALARFTGAPVA